MDKRQTPSLWDSMLFELTLIFSGVYLLIFDIPSLARWFFGYCALMGVLCIVNFYRRRAREAKGKE